MPKIQTKTGFTGVNLGLEKPWRCGDNSHLHRELGRHREDEKILGISDKTLLSLKNHTTMFREGHDWRRKGASERSPLQWNVESTEQAFTNWKRPAPSTVETFERVGAK